MFSEFVGKIDRYRQILFILGRRNLPKKMETSLRFIISIEHPLLNSAGPELQKIMPGIIGLPPAGGALQ